MTLCAIDPGASGGIAWSHDGHKACCVPMPETEMGVVNTIRSFAPNATFYLEDLVKHMGGGIPASAMAVYASNWGVLKGAILMAGCPLHLVTPQRWQKALGMGTKARNQTKPQWKRKLKAEAERLYPHLDVTLKTADALLILEYGRLHSGGTLNALHLAQPL